MDNIEIRAERRGDVAAIRDLAREAFGRDFEADVVDRLRASVAFLPELSLVALERGVVVGHALVTAQTVDGDDGTVTDTTILAPLAVAPSHQNLGIGTILTCAVLDAARALGHTSMILVGHPAYYPRFGFRPASSWSIRYSRPIPDDVFMAIELAPGALANASGIVTLSAAFEEAS